MGWLVMAMISNSLLLQRILAYCAAAPGTQTPGYGVGLAIAYLFTEIGRSIFVNRHWITANTAGMALRAGARSLLYAKTLTIANAGRSTSGALTQLMLSDGQRLQEACSYADFLWTTPITLLVALGIMWSQVGPSALAGMAVMLLFVPLQVSA